jgi:hypothetical protein
MHSVRVLHSVLCTRPGGCLDTAKGMYPTTTEQCILVVFKSPPSNYYFILNSDGHCMRGEIASLARVNHVTGKPPLFDFLELLKLRSGTAPTCWLRSDHNIGPYNRKVLAPMTCSLNSLPLYFWWTTTGVRISRGHPEALDLGYSQCFYERYIVQKRYKEILREYLTINSHFFSGWNC